MRVGGRNAMRSPDHLRDLRELQRLVRELSYRSSRAELFLSGNGAVQSWLR
jgi:hypothetical protein